MKKHGLYSKWNTEVKYQIKPVWENAISLYTIDTNKWKQDTGLGKPSIHDTKYYVAGFQVIPHIIYILSFICCHLTSFIYRDQNLKQKE